MRLWQRQRRCLDETHALLVHTSLHVSWSLLSQPRCFQPTFVEFVKGLQVGTGDNQGDAAHRLVPLKGCFVSPGLAKISWLEVT